MASLDAQKCLEIIREGLLAMSEREFPLAEQILAAALAAARTLPKEEAQRIFPLVTASLSLLRLREGKTEESAKFRAVAIPLLDQFGALDDNRTFPQLTAHVLNELQEYHRAIPFYEQSAQLLSDANDPIGVAMNLHSAGKCYSRCGLLDHGAIPLRAAVKIYREYPGDPNFPAALLNLGIALAKSAPTEAEAAYKESAAFYEAKMQLASAAPAWVNLGILCSKQDRHAESLDWYERALHVREQSPSTPPARLGTLLNNMANCHRRAGNFPEAHAAIDRALTLLKPEDGFYFASAYGTRGLIFSDEHRDAEAVPWLTQAIEAHQKMPSPNVESIATNVEAAIVSLRRLHRLDEAAAAEQGLATLRAAQQNAPPAMVDISGLGDDLGTRATRSTGAVIIELDCGPRSGTLFTADDVAKLAERLSLETGEHETGFYGGRVTIPESTTLMFYGEDAEALYRTLRPVLDDYLIAEGARIAIRQGTQLREVVLPRRVM
jgi:tetratricopeptide (TPR) repeat protein